MKLHRELGISLKSAWKLEHKLRGGCDYLKSNLDSTIEIYESYFVGKESNKHAGEELHAGRGTVGKAAVADINHRDWEI